ncbi:MAG: methyltransferase domain-containing protein [Acidimicrobiales bacterium]
MGGLMDDVAREARRRRAAGEVPEALEREVGAAIERFAAKRGLAEGPDGLLAALVRASVIDAAVPLPDRGAPGAHSGPAALARRPLRKLMAWYVEYLAQQSARFASAEVGSLRMLGQRLSALEARSEAGTPGTPGPAGGAALARQADISIWLPLVLDRLGEAKGRVLHVECGDGWLLRALAAHGLDAYGVDPGASAPDPSGLEFWPDDALGHLGAVADAGLAGLVLSGVVEDVSPARARRLAGLAAAKLGPGGRLVLISADPSSDSAAPSPAADLAGGCSPHPATWQHLLASAGLAITVAHLGPDSFAVSASA